MAPPDIAAAGVFPASSRFMLLVDARIPSGGYAHSGGMEAAVADGRVQDLDDLLDYLQGRLSTSGLSDAGLAVASFDRRAELSLLCKEAAARCPSPALRAASRAEGRGLLRVARAMWPSPELEDLAAADRHGGPMWPLVVGTVARVAGLQAGHAGIAAAQASVSGAAWAAVRLLGLDPYAVAGALAGLAGAVDETADRALSLARQASSLRFLPARAAPLQEVAAEQRENWEVRLFVS